MSSSEIDDYLDNVPQGQREVLSALRLLILKTIPDAEQCISYRVPAFRLESGIVAGFASFKHHMSYLPFSGSVLGELSDRLSQYHCSKSALRFTIEEPLGEDLVQELIAVRLAEIRSRGR
ncbi:MAG: DUF1801 domain-containing protein [Acidimicrobiales bacterium]